jgi:putative tryptophan/tyrosine transport system substrate-binding protein
MRRRLAVAAGGWALAAPWAALAQRPALPVIGYLSGVSRAESETRLAAFRRGLEQAGFREGGNVALDFRFADGDYGRLAAMAAELVRQPVNLVVATGGPRAAQAAKAATSTVPIVFVLGGDPVKFGLVQSLNRPGGNATGVSFLTADLMPKRFELLMQLLPRAKLVALMINPNTPSADDQLKGVEAAARAAGTRLLVARAGSEAEIDNAFATLAKARPDALLIGTDALFGTRHKQFIALAAHHGLPAVYEQRNAVADGGLMSYGPSIIEAHVQTGLYAGRVLAGTKPAELPVLQPTTFELVVNRGTARALGLAVPQALLLRADEVIE